MSSQRLRGGRAALVACAWVGACVIVPPVAEAQSSGPPSGSLFGTDPLRGAARRLDLTVGLSVASDDNLGADQGVQPAPASEPVAGRYSNLDGMLAFTRAYRRLDLSVRGGGSVRHYPGLNNFVGSSYSGATDVKVAVGRRTTLQANVAGNHVSSFFEVLSRQPATQRGERAVGAWGSGVAASQSLDAAKTTYSTTVEMLRTVNRRTSLGIAGTVGRSEDPAIGDRAGRWVLGPRVTRNAGRDLSLRLGYAAGVGTQMAGHSTTRLWTHDVEAGVDRRWSHSNVRHTTVSVTGGPSLLLERTDRLAPARTRTANVPGRLSRLRGTVSVVHDFSRDWNARAFYRRGTALSEVRLVSDTAGVEVLGAAGPRVVVALSAGYTNGELDVRALPNRDTTSFASGRIQVALSRHVAAYGQYFAYQYTFPLPTRAAPLYPQDLGRRGVRAGITMWTPLQRGAS